MEQKEKITALMDMGFSLDEALALASGNYRMVPDKPAANEPQIDKPAANEPQIDKPAANEPQIDKPAADEHVTEKLNDFNTKLNQLFNGLQSSIDKLQQTIIKQNINDDQQPAQLSASDILGQMLEPVKPEERR